MENSNRIVFLDWLRAIACFMVILVHCIEPFYLGGPEGTYIASKSNALWVTLVNSLLRPAVPLFVMASSYLLLPLKTDTGTFFRKRFVRVLIPFLIWTLLYVFAYPYVCGIEPNFTGSLKGLAFNFLMSSGHLWFIYMLLGVYLLMPLISPWMDKVSRKEERGFLILWAFTTVIPLLRPFAGAVTGSTDLWGECPWNEFGTFYYISGFIGFLILGHYFRKYAGELSWTRTLAIAVPFWFIGYAVTAGGFWHYMPRGLGFPLSASYETAVEMETTWNFCTFGVMMQTVAYFLLIRKITVSGWIYDHFVLPVSKLSYGMYLMHMFILTPVFTWINSTGLAMPLVIFTSALITYAACALTARLLSLLPKSRYLVG